MNDWQKAEARGERGEGKDASRQLFQDLNTYSKTRTDRRQLLDVSIWQGGIIVVDAGLALLSSKGYDGSYRNRSPP
jgi:ketosteroid isomerase-like protein